MGVLRTARAALSAVVLMVAGRAYADPSEAQLQAARAAFEEGLRLEEYRDFVGALERFETIAALKVTPQVRFHRALCLEKLGRWGDARQEFVHARDESSPGGTADLDRVHVNSEAHVSWLDERMPRLSLSLIPSNARVMLDARVLSLASSRSPIPLDPGPHILRATAPAHAELVERLDIKAQQHLRASVFLQKLGPAESKSAERTRAPLYISGGVAAASFVAAGVAYALRGGVLKDLQAQCGADRQQCPESARGLDARGATLTTAGNVFIGVALSAAAVAIGSFVWSHAGEGQAPIAPPSRLQFTLLRRATDGTQRL